MSDIETASAIAVEEIQGLPIRSEPTTEPCALVIFGANGDLSRRKLVPALYNLMVDGALPNPIAIIGIDRRTVTPDEFRASLRESTAQFSRRQPIDSTTWSAFAGAVDFTSGRFEDAKSYNSLKTLLERADRDRGTGGNQIFYLATPPQFFPVIIENLHRNGLLHKESASANQPFCRVIIEKPFGRDLASAQTLNQLLAAYLNESQTFRIDHYLGKETVQNILVLRFGNSIFEPLWNRKYIDHVQIDAAESIGVDDRGRFYDSTGVMRDVAQNHLLQVLALSAMEAPTSLDGEDVRDEKMQVFRALRPIVGADIRTDVVRAQYRGYRNEEGVSPDSRTPTYVAMKVMIDNWRWQGVPFYLRTGKHLARKRTCVSVHFQSVPLCLFPQPEACQILQPNVLTLRIQPHEGVSLRFVAKVPGEHLAVGNVRMNMSYADAFHKPISEAYERLLLDCMRGDATLFMRRDGVEQSWRFVTPILEEWDADARSPVPQYEPGSMGPPEADALIARDGRHWAG
jgi:glucose-6-phosphate 1-dehydrogenase